MPNSSRNSSSRLVKKAFANMRELAEAAIKTRIGAFTIIRERAMQNIEDMKKLMQFK
jgi:hypothetical protein